MRTICGLIAALLLAGSVQAQDLPFDEPSDLVSTLVVRARNPGPAWWKVTKGASTVWVLGAIDMIPEGMAWDDSTLRRRLAGAKLLLLPPSGRASNSTLNAFERDGPKLASDSRSLAERLTPALADRALAVSNPSRVWAITVTNPQRTLRVETRSPKAVIMALSMLGAADRALGPMETRPAEKRALDLAQARRLKTESVLIYDPIRAERAMLAMSDKDQLACLTNILPVREAGGRAEIRKERAQAWVQGDVPGVVKPLGRLCPVPAALSEDNAEVTRKTVSAIEAALKAPGQTVAVVSLTQLLALDGVMARLGRHGYQITAPDSLSDD